MKQARTTRGSVPAGRTGPQGGPYAFADAVVAVVRATGLDEALRAIARHAARLFDAPYAAAAVVDSTGGVTARRAVGARRVPPGDAAALIAAASGKRPIHVVDTAGNGTAEPPAFAGAGYRSRLALPLLDGAKAVGALALYGRGARAFESREPLAEAFSRVAGTALGAALRTQGMSTRNENESLDRRVVRDVCLPLVVMDGSYRVLRFSRAFCALFPGTRRGTGLLSIFHPPGLREILGEVARAGEPAREVEIEDRVPEAGNRTGAAGGAVYRITASRLSPDSSGALLLLTVQDVTEHRLELAGLVEKGRMVAVGEMAAGVAHELNNPLTAVLGFSELLLRQNVDDVMRRDLEAIAAEAHRAGRVVDNLLSFARRRRAEMRSFDAAESVRRVLDLRAYECKVNNIEIVTYFDPDTPRTMADPHALEQVFLNLLNNAIQAISADSGSGTITVGVVALDGKLRISFTDDGPGIPPDVMPKLFDPFFTTKPAGQGTGLGLSICYGIVHQHGGTIRAESHPRRGATFVVEIPLEPVVEKPGAAPSVPEAEPVSHTMLRVLAVDDEAAVVELMARALTSFGHEVDVATEGADALRMIHLADYDAIILDLKMPGLSGADVFRALRGMHPELASRVLFATGDIGSPGTREFLFATGARVLYKPFGLDALRRHMDAFARAKEERQTGEALPGHRGFRAGSRVATP